MRWLRWTGCALASRSAGGPAARPARADVPFEALVTALMDGLADQPGHDEVLLVLDDYHVIGAQPVHASVKFLVEHRAGRTSPGAGQPIRSAAGTGPATGPRQLAELRAAELRFTASEAAELLRQVAAGPGPALPDAAVAALAARTEGSAAGLRLGPCTARSGGCDRVRDGVHRQQPLCPGLPGRGGAGAPGRGAAHLPAGNLGAGKAVRPALQRGHRPSWQPGPAGPVEARGLFLVPLDEVRGWWRYHHLFADLLRARLEQQPGRAERRFPLATPATWYAGRGLADERDPARGRPPGR